MVVTLRYLGRWCNGAAEHRRCGTRRPHGRQHPRHCSARGGARPPAARYSHLSGLEELGLCLDSGAVGGRVTASARSAVLNVPHPPIVLEVGLPARLLPLLAVCGAVGATKAG